MLKGMTPKKNRRPKAVMMAFVLSMLVVFFTGCTTFDYSILQFMNGKIGTPQVGPDVNIEVPNDLDFDFNISQDLLLYLQSLESFDIENITNIEDLRLLLQKFDVDIDLDLDSLLAGINNMKAPAIPVKDIDEITDEYINVDIYIGCSNLEDFDPALYNSVSVGGVILDMTGVAVKDGSTVNDFMSDLLSLTGENIPVVSDASGEIISISGIINDTREHLTNLTYYDCYWICAVNDVPPTGGADYQLQDGDMLIYYYRCDPI